MRALDIQNLITGLLDGIGEKNLINLSPGKVITAFLKEVQGNSCTLVCDGKEIIARLETDLPPGRKLKLLVEGEKNGQTVLKLLSSDADENEIPLRGITGRLGLTDNSLNLKLVGEMIKQQMPLTPASTAKISGFIKSTNIPEQEVWIPVFMDNNGIQLTRQNFAQVTGLLTDLEFINNDLTELSAGLQTLIMAEPGSGFAETAQKAVNILNGLNLDPDLGRETMAAKLELAVRLLTRTKQVAAQENNGDNTMAGDTGNQTGETVENNNQPVALKNNNLLVSTKDDLQGLKAREPEAVGELGPMLEKLALSLKEYNSGEHKEVARLIQNVSEKIEFVRNFNLKADMSRENMMVFYSTVQFEDGKEPLRLVVKYQNGKEKNHNFSSCRLERKLNTPGLGTVTSEVQVSNKNLSIQFITTNEPAGKALDLFSGILSERLTKMDYIINYLPARVEIGPDNNFLPENGTELQGLFQLDLTV